MGIVYENEQPVERVILVGISERNGDDTESSLAELAELAATAGAGDSRHRDPEPGTHASGNLCGNR